jgi:HNH endonuclease
MLNRCVEAPRPAGADSDRDATATPMTTAEILRHVAETDATFERRGADWVGKCLICNGPIAFDARTGEGATLEHVRARSRGGTEELENLGVVHGRCNWEKGRNWDSRRRRGDDEYDAFVARILERRRARWRDPIPEADAHD